MSTLVDLSATEAAELQQQHKYYQDEMAKAKDEMIKLDKEFSIQTQLLKQAMNLGDDAATIVDGKLYYHNHYTLMQPHLYIACRIDNMIEVTHQRLHNIFELQRVLVSFIKLGCPCTIELVWSVRFC